MSLITPMGHCDVTLALYDVNGERRVVVKINGAHIIEDDGGGWVTFRPDRREFVTLGEAVSWAQTQRT